MIETLPFQTRARTVDHLGREQIADCPTAISELWKNAYDAYARIVELHVFDGEHPVAGIYDDGHGMSKDEFLSKWLVIGTESKATSQDTLRLEDRDGLPERPRQGQKGIGRLSCAAIGPLLLLVSKRKDHPFLASLIDWRLFENPFLILSDIQIPVVTFADKSELPALIPQLFEQLTSNIWGNERDPARQSRLQLAWQSYDRQAAETLPSSEEGTDRPPLPSEEIAETLISATFDERHLSKWSVWNGKSEKGTCLLSANLHFDLLAQLRNSGTKDAAEQATTDKFFETLSSFVDPLAEEGGRSTRYKICDFNYAAYAWLRNKETKDDNRKEIVSSQLNFSIQDISGMEHTLDGRFDHDGIFTGRVKAFGEWFDDVEIIPPRDLQIPNSPSSFLGPIDIFLATMEFNFGSTTHSREEFVHYKELAARYSGLLVHRDGLRVLPFGRTDADFFGIEERRSKHAGREFWNYRQLFGGVGISRKFNPNLKDKAGREGLLDNRAAKTLRSLIINLLMESARRYFGTDATVRQELLPEIKEENRKAKADAARKKLRQARRDQFQKNLKAFRPAIAELVTELAEPIRQSELTDQDMIEAAQERVDQAWKTWRSYVLGSPPKALSSANQSEYEEFQRDKAWTKNKINEFQTEIDRALEENALRSPYEYAVKQVQSHSASLSHHIRSYKNRIEALQKAEFDRIHDVITERNKLFHARSEPILSSLKTGQSDLGSTLKVLRQLREALETENENLFSPYIGALESLNESIDLELLATFGGEEVSELRSEVDRLNALAQLGIAIEIMGHELHSFDDLIASGLRSLPQELQQSDAYLSIETGYQSLVDQLRFLTPLKLSGDRTQAWVKGEQIFAYMNRFFGTAFQNSGIQFSATDAFKDFQVFDRPARLYPVFINLINNSRYWVAQGENSNRKILLDVKDERVIVSDNGPGVAKEDVKEIFTIFFTKKQKGGRGVGLYLCRANLIAGGHKIEYLEDPQPGLLPGANFAIDFKGAKYA